MDTKKVKSCPFCGSSPSYHETESTLAIIWCPKCKIEFREYAETAVKAGKKVLRLWNRRNYT
jgi:hypothetical protein